MGKGSWLRVAAILSLFGSTACHSSSSTTSAKASHQPPDYRIACADAGDCLESVALLVGVSGPEEPTRCTASLIGPRTAVTARHCVAAEIARGGRCEGVWLGFAGRDDLASQWVPCVRVRNASRAAGTLFAPDFALLSLAHAPDRAPLAVGRGHLDAGEVVRMISITPNRFYDDVHEMRSRRCIVDAEGELTAWTPVAPPTVRVLSSCPIHLGNSGAPLLDQRGRMRGLVHAGGPPYFAFGLMTESATIR